GKGGRRRQGSGKGRGAGAPPLAACRAPREAAAMMSSCANVRSRAASRDASTAATTPVEMISIAISLLESFAAQGRDAPTPFTHFWQRGVTLHSWVQSLDERPPRRE